MLRPREIFEEKQQGERAMEPAKERSGHDGDGVKEELNRYESSGFEEGFNEKTTAIDQVGFLLLLLLILLLLLHVISWRSFCGSDCRCF